MSKSAKRRRNRKSAEAKGRLATASERRAIKRAKKRDLRMSYASS